MDLTSNNKTHTTLDTITPPPTQPTNTPKSLPFSNGTLKRHPFSSAAPPSSMAVISYKECLKNHAATIGGHALDGCGEFMPSSSTNPADPRSLKCAACGCHRNFHRREPPESTTTAAAAPTTTINTPNFINCFYSPTSPTTAPPPPPPQPLPHRGISQSTSPSLSSSPSQSPMSSPSSPPPLSHVPPYHHHSSAAPHMLLALGTAYPAAPQAPQPPSSDHPEHHYRSVFSNSNSNNNCSVLKGSENNTPIPNRSSSNSNNKKRYRTKFSSEQKEKMQSFSEKLGWRMNKGDDVAVQEFCNDIGVPRGVFKVWMHNNKIKRSSSSELAPPPPPPPPSNIIINDHKMNGADHGDNHDDGNDNNGGGFVSDINSPIPNYCSNGDNSTNVHVPINNALSS